MSSNQTCSVQSLPVHVNLVNEQRQRAKSPARTLAEAVAGRTSTVRGRQGVWWQGGGGARVELRELEVTLLGRGGATSPPLLATQAIVGEAGRSLGHCKEDVVAVEEGVW